MFLSVWLSIRDDATSGKGKKQNRWRCLGERKREERMEERGEKSRRVVDGCTQGREGAR